MVADVFGTLRTIFTDTVSNDNFVKESRVKDQVTTNGLETNKTHFQNGRQLSRPNKSTIFFNSTKVFFNRVNRSS